jgi:hypothetical protein
MIGESPEELYHEEEDQGGRHQFNEGMDVFGVEKLFNGGT